MTKKVISLKSGKRQLECVLMLAGPYSSVFVLPSVILVRPRVSLPVKRFVIRQRYKSWPLLPQWCQCPQSIFPALLRAPYSGFFSAAGWCRRDSRSSSRFSPLCGCCLPSPSPLSTCAHTLRSLSPAAHTPSSCLFGAPAGRSPLLRGLLIGHQYLSVSTSRLTQVQAVWAHW